jgi:hypothetical protein
MTKYLGVMMLVGCNGDPASKPPASGITGVDQVVHWDDQGNSHASASRPDDIYLEAVIADGDIRPASIADDGSFAFPGDAPTGRYWVRIVDGRLTRDDLYVLTDATTLDLGIDVVGDADAVSTGDTTRIVVEATGLAPWQDRDDADFLIANAGFQSSLATFYASNTPVAGDTALHDLTYVWEGLPLAAHPAAASFVQIETAHDDALGVDYDAPAKVFVSDPVTIAEGETTQIAGAFTDIPAFDVPVNWKRSAFAAQAAAMHPPGCTHEVDSETFWVHALPGAGSHGTLANSFDDLLGGVPSFGPRIVDNLVPLLDETDVSGTLHVANPYPDNWVYAKYEIAYAVTCPTGAWFAEATIGLVSELFDTPVVPFVGPVGAPTIEGRDLFTPQDGVGLTPTIRWAPPAIGTATEYELHISELRPAGLGGGRMLREDAELIVPGDVTEATVPPDVLVPGTRYVVRIRAITRIDQHVASAPFRAGLPLGYADLYTGDFQP